MALYFNMKDRNSKKRPSLLAWSSVLSIALHIAFLLYQMVPSLRLDQIAEESKNIPIEIADLPKEYLTQRPSPLQPKAKTKEQQMAETEDAHNRKIDPNAQFLGEHNQKALKQTKAARVDDFRTKQGTGAKGKSPEKAELIPPTGEGAGTESESKDEISLGENLAEEKTGKGVKRNWKTLSLKDLSVGGDGGATAATDDHLKGVDSGEGTVLSTREFRFYSYYHRIKELLRQYWKPNVERQVARIWNKGKSITSNELTTKVSVLLDEGGKIQKISKVQSSGFFEIDEAAIEAFQKAAPFPNPPKGIIDADGFVRISWDFILQTEAGPVIQFRSHGAAPN